MGFTRDLWTQPEKPAKVISERLAGPGKTCRCGKPALKVCTVKGGEEVGWCGENGRIRNPKRWGKGKRYLAVWHDPDGNEKTKAFTRKTPADLHWQAMETDVERGDYVDPKAGKETFGNVAKRFFGSRKVDPTSAVKYESVYRLHVEPKFGTRAVKSLRPSDISGFQTALGERFGPSTVATARLIIVGVLDLALADELVKKNVATNKVVQTIDTEPPARVVAWSDDVVFRIIDAHPELLRTMPIVSATCGLREGELFALSEEDIDYEAGVIHVRRQLKKIGRDHIFGLPKNDTERTIPLPAGTAQALREHIRKHPPEPLTLAWEKVGGPLVTHRILFRWFDGGHIKPRAYSETVWKPAVATAGVIPEPTKDARGRKRYVTTRREGTHQLRHYYASVMLADGVNIKELAEYLGHHNASYTLKKYTHLLPNSHDRARSAMDARMFRPRAVG